MLSVFSGVYFLYGHAVRPYMIEINNQYAISWIANVKEAENIYKSKYGRYGNLPRSGLR